MSKKAISKSSTTMYTYIKRNVPGIYLQYEEWIDPEKYDVGSSWEDYINGKFIELSADQVKFHEEYPNASVKEVWEMALTPVPEYVRTIEDAKREKLHAIEMYDTSSNVNSFTVNHMISAWFTVQERLNYKQSVEAAKLLSVPELSFYIGNMELSVAPELAEGMLAQLQLYADQCFIVTKKHQIVVESLETIEEVDSYDYTVGYPAKLNFDIVVPVPVEPEEEEKEEEEVESQVEDAEVLPEE